MKPVIETFLLTGLRRGELIHLTWADVDFKNKILSVQAKGDWQPKDYETRHIPMTPRLAEVLQNHPRNGDSFVFVNRQGQPLDPDVLSLDFLKLVRRRGIKGVTVHTPAPQLRQPPRDERRRSLHGPEASRPLQHQDHRNLRPLGPGLSSNSYGTPKILIRVGAHARAE
ncbi:MAG TPA: tyrosine-type recombinase/integrase [Elusimicrobiota bacterium]|nr:tyrosine-type recombinase/integrase [Elusimicrobiota bacterium]